jgi:hypothetical protein
VVLPVGDGAVVVVELESARRSLSPCFFARLGLGQADLRQFGVGVGGPGDVIGARLGGQAEQHRADDDARVVARDMGELQPARGVADGIDPLVVVRRRPLSTVTPRRS